MFKLDEKESKNIYELLDNFDFICDRKRKNIRYLNVASAFDIESTSFYVGMDKSAIMYAWVFGINGKFITGRTWEEFINILDIVSDYYKLGEVNKLIVYVHNLEFEFQFFKDRFEWENIFALNTHEVCYARTNNGIEFRCSYKLTNYSLAKLGEECVMFPIKKMVGDLDYKLLRSPITKLTKKEWKYIYNDALVVMSYIEQCRINEGYDISKIPLTKTGYVRRFCREFCFFKGHKHNKEGMAIKRKYWLAMKSLTLEGEEEYKMCKRAFIGGHTHTNPLASLEVIPNVHSYDLTSSYP